MTMIDVTVKSKKWRDEKNIEQFIKKNCKKIILLTDLKKLLKKDFQLEVMISLVSDAQIKKINSRFRNKNKPTDVLSFSNLDENLIRKIGLVKTVSSSKHLVLGDIVLAYETIKNDSLQQKKNFRKHLIHLVTHGILHLIGHDHETSELAYEMEKLEIKILKKLNIQNPYI